jgi:GABA permease
MLATVLASLVAAAFLPDSLMTEKLTRRGVRVGGELHADVLRTTLVGDVMNLDVETIPASVWADGDVVSVPSTVPLADALAVMVEEGLEHLPVVDHDRLVGMCTRADIVRARAEQAALERRQTGWLRPLVDRRRPRRVLLVGNRTLGHPDAAAALSGKAPDGRLHVHVLVPTGPHDGDGAPDRLAAQVAALRAAGYTADGEVVAGRPVAAVRQILRRETFDEIILSTLPPGLSAWLRIDASARIERLSRLPVTHVVAGSDTLPQPEPESP